MRMLGRVAGAIVVAAGMLTAAGTTPAVANGGAYFELTRTYYERGTVAVARYEVVLPKGKTHLADAGPFTVYVTPANGRAIEAGTAVPSDATRVGTASVTQTGDRRLVVTARFVVPDVRTGDYSLGMCNEPCTLDGFGEPVSGFLTIVQTPYEAALLQKVDDLKREAGAAERRARKLDDTVVQLRAAGASAEGRLDGLLFDAQEMADRIRTLEAAPSPRPLIGDPAGWVVAATLGVAAGVLIGRRRRPATGLAVEVEA